MTSTPTMRIVCGTTHHTMAATIAAALRCELTIAEVERFPDGELRPRVGDVRGEDVFVVAPTGPPVSEHLVELLLLADACRRGGAARLTVVAPYFAYARQDRRSSSGESVGVRVVADAIASAGVQRLVVVDPHTNALEAMCAIATEMITAVPVLAGALRGDLAADAVVVAPDFGAVKLAQRYAALLQRPLAIVSKTRLSAEQVAVEAFTGDVAGRSVVIVDDMISTGGTVEAAARVALDHGARPGIVVAATHGLLTGQARARLGAAATGIRAVLVTDSVPQTERAGVRVEVHTVGGLLADVIARLGAGRDVGELLVRS